MPSPSDALRNFAGMYGSAWRDNVQLMNVTEVSGNVAINQIEVPLVGQTKTGYKAGRETRTGTMTIRMIDMRWEMEIYQFLSQSLAARRSARGGVGPNLNNPRLFDLKLEIDDPEAGYSAWQLENCQIWQLPVGFSIGDDLISREFPFTWESETPLSGFVYNSSYQPVPIS